MARPAISSATTPLSRWVHARVGPTPTATSSRAPGLQVRPRSSEPRTGTLRSVHTLTSTYTNEAGEKVASVTNHRNWKSVYLTSTEENTWVEAYHEPTALDARSDAYKDLPDGEYTLTIEASNDGPSSAEQSISYTFRIDATAPVISNLTYGGEGPDMVISFDVTDASPLAGVDLHDPADGLCSTATFSPPARAASARMGSTATTWSCPL